MAQATSSPEPPLIHNLPRQLTGFIGREVEVTELRRLLRERRLVTLTGAGGSGKTRLALEAARAMLEDFPEGAFLVDLAPLSRPELVAEAVGSVLGVQAPPDRSVLDSLADFLCARRTLLILDNCEHLLDPCATLAKALLATCPDLRLLATSREPLGVGGECTFRVPLLSVPGTGDWTDPDSLLGFEAVLLFLDRARLADPGFALNDGNAAAVAQICTRLDGIPLALELAAAALRAISVQELAGRLDQRFRLLTSGDREALPRHQTLTALLDWSYALLGQDEQVVFRRLSIFPADWTLNAAESICGAGTDTVDVLATLMDLVNKSVVQLDPATGRYRMLETVRLYARSKLNEVGEQEGDALRHLDWVLQFAQQAASQLGGPRQLEWFVRLESEQANLRGALSEAIAAGWSEKAAELALSLWRYWLARAHHREARRWIEQILAAEGAAALPAAARARLLGSLGTLTHTMNEFELAGSYHEEALSIWRSQGDRAGTARALLDLGWGHYQAMDLRCARQYAEESLALARQSGDLATVASALNLFAVASVEAGPAGAVLPALDESLAIWRSLGVLPEVASTLSALAIAEQRLGHLGRAAGLMLESLRLQISLGDYGGMIGCLVVMVYFEFDLHRPTSGRADSEGYQPLAYLDHGQLLNGPVEAARILGIMGAWEEHVLGGDTVQWTALVVPLCEKLRAEMGAVGFEREFAAGGAMSVDEILTLAEEVVRPYLSPPPDSGPKEGAALPDGSAALAATSLRRAAAAAPNSSSRGPLTPREAEVLRLVAGGWTNREVGERLTITTRTVNAHLTSIYAKLGVTSRAGAVRYAIEHGLG